MVAVLPKGEGYNNPLIVFAVEMLSQDVCYSYGTGF